MKKMNITIAKLVPFDVISFLQVEDKSAKQTYFFLCQRWLATDEDDGQIMRTLVPVDPSLKAKMGSGSKSIRDEVALEQKGRKHETSNQQHIALTFIHAPASANLAP